MPTPSIDSEAAVQPAARPGDRRHVVAAAADLPPGSRKVVQVGGREIGIFNVDGRLYALRNRCPHRGAPLCLGRVRPQVVDAGVYGVEYQQEGQILKCPWHLWEFDITTGRTLFSDQVRVRTYRVVQEGEEIALYA